MAILIGLQVDALAHAHALGLVDEERVGLDRNVVLEVELATDQALEWQKL